MTASMAWSLRPFLGVLTLGVLLVAGVPAHAADAAYHFLKEIPIGGEGGWDYLSVDAGARRLYVTHSSKVVVIDLDVVRAVGKAAERKRGVDGRFGAPCTRIQPPFVLPAPQPAANICSEKPYLDATKPLSKHCKRTDDLCSIRRYSNGHGHYFTTAAPPSNLMRMYVKRST